MSSRWRAVAVGAAAGAAGTAALNATTFVDMALRGRPASETPEQTVEQMVERSPFDLPGDEQARRNRVAGLAPLLGSVAGAAGGVVAALARDALSIRGFAPTAGVTLVIGMLVGNAPMTLLGITLPRTWSAADWAADVVPHLAYAAVAAGVLVAADA